ncbi:hypothetical protein [Halopiger aswanensis]|uniref:Uncharacterized protein n=1 Tax=Halopiger aswanensis TaxID=148449 RepID=A0A419WQT5_9EURY|nr:hypothetical protein [Halopiger aswanensis]RKD97777.1 hypothetical protein ATJ93_0769 [Halopiger aswanensis]
MGLGRPKPFARLPRIGAALRPLRPRVVLALLLFASLAGCWIVGSRGGDPAAVVREWIVLLGLGATLGGVGWRLVLYPGRVPADEACRSFVDLRYALIELLAVVGAAVGAASAVAGTISSSGGPHTPLRPLALSTIVLALAVDRVGDGTTDRWWRFLAVLGGASALTVTAADHVLSVGGGPVDVAVRVGHLGAFAVWFGGALWHNVVVVGVARRFPDSREPLRAQAFAFRRVVAVLLPAVVLTGLEQAATFVGTTSTVYLETVPGRLVVAKAGVIAALALIAATARK